MAGSLPRKRDTVYRFHTDIRTTVTATIIDNACDFSRGKTGWVGWREVQDFSCLVLNYIPFSLVIGNVC